MSRESDLSEASFSRESGADSDFGDTRGGGGGYAKPYRNGGQPAPHYDPNAGQQAHYGGGAPGYAQPGPYGQPPMYGGQSPYGQQHQQQQGGYGYPQQQYPQQQQQQQPYGYPQQQQYGAGTTVIPYAGTTAVIVDPNVMNPGAVSQSGRRASRVALMLLIIGALNLVSAGISIGRGLDIADLIAVVVTGVIFIGVGVFGRSAVRADDAARIRSFGRMMMFCAVIAIVNSLIGLVFAIILLTEYDEEEEKLDEDYVGVMQRRVELIITAIAFIGNLVLCPLFTTYVRTHATNMTLAETNHQNMPTVEMSQVPQ